LLFLGAFAVFLDELCLFGDLLGEDGCLSSCLLSGLDFLGNVSTGLGNSLLLGINFKLQLLLVALFLLYL